MSITWGRASRPPLPIAPLVLVLVMGLPLIWLWTAAMGAAWTGSNALAANMLPTAVRETGVLMISVGVATGVIGLLAAWLVSHFDFPMRRWLDWALVLPLAVPTYLAAYAFVEFFDFTGPLQELVRAINGATTIKQYWFPQIRSDAGASFVFSMVLYPYVYVSCRAFFLMQGGSVTAAARTLGENGYRTFFSVTLPLARPALVVGATLAMMEVINDLGAVQYFGINSLTAVIYSTWIIRSNFGGAAQLAVTIVLIVGLLILAEQRARSTRVYLANRDSRMPPPRERLRGGRALLATLFCASLVGLGFGVPLFEFGHIAFRPLEPSNLALVASAGLNSIMLGAVGAAATVAIGWFAARHSTGDRQPLARGAIRFATLGYAVPGTVLALGLLQPLGLADLYLNRITVSLFGWRPGLVFSGSVLALIFVYATRFLAVSHATLEAGMKKRGRSMLEAAEVLGAHRWEVLARIDLPTMSPALLSAATLVFVEIIKELPATLLLRPLGLETLATVAYSRANVSLFADASLPALMIVLVGLVPVILATKLSAQRKD